MRSRRTGLGILAAAAGLLACVWLTFPAAAPPLYDGIILPNQAYRYLRPPPGQLNPGNPTSASLSVSVAEEKSVAEVVQTSEVPPQALLFMDSDSVRVPPGVKKITFVVKPVLPPSNQPDGTIDGNTYAITATGDNGVSLGFKRGANVRVQLRGTGAPGKPELEQYTGGHWTRLATVHLGSANTFFALVTSLGDFALVLPGKTSSSGFSTYLPYLFLAVAVVALLVGGLLAIRLSRQRFDGQDGPEETPA